MHKIRPSLYTNSPGIIQTWKNIDVKSNPDYDFCRMKSFRREQLRQIARINLEFWSLIRGFEESLFGDDWDNFKNPEYPIFKKYSEIWKSYCKHYTIGYKRIVFPDPDAFGKYAFENIIEPIKPGGIDTVNDGKQETGSPAQG